MLSFDPKSPDSLQSTPDHLDLPPDLDWSTEGYFSALLSAVRSASPDLPLDPVILQSILLCLVAPGGTRNLLLRVKDEDITFVQNLTATILLKVFGFSTQKVRSRPKHSSSELLHSLFIHDKLPSKRRKARASRSDRSRHLSSSEPSEHVTPTGEIKEWNSAPSIKQSSTDLSQRRPRIRLLEIQTDSSPLTLKDFESTSSAQCNANDQMFLPRAIVFSGLEKSASAQRALLEVLTEQRVLFEDGLDELYTLPEDFIAVYVCPVDLWERPKIHTSLLDRFAVSVNVSPSASVRQSYNSFRPELQAFSTSLVPIISSTDIAYLRSLTVHLHPSLTLYMNDLFTAARHHHELDGTLLTTRAHKDAVALVRAQRLLCGDSTSTQLIRSAKTKTPEDSRTRADEAYDDMKTIRVSLDKANTPGDKGKEVDCDSFFWQPREERDVRMDVSEVDVARIVPRVISHRLRVREGPDHEIFSSVMYPAASPSLQEKGGGHRKTVKEIIVKILSDT